MIVIKISLAYTKCFLTCTQKKYCKYNLYKKSTYKQKCKNLNHKIYKTNTC